MVARRLRDAGCWSGTAFLRLLLVSLVLAVSADDDAAAAEYWDPAWDFLPQVVGPSLADQGLIGTTSEEADRQRAIEAKVAANETRNHTMWEGEFEGMSARKIFALTGESFVMCWGRASGSGCRTAVLQGEEAAANSTAAEGEEKSEVRSLESQSLDSPAAPLPLQSDDRLLPPLPWGSNQLFHAGSAKRVEVERLDDARFVVCFERLASADAGATVACVVGLIEDGLLRPFAEPLELGEGKLVSIIIAAAGRRFAVCAQLGTQPQTEASASPSKPSESAVCRWASVSGGSAIVPKWTKDKPLKPLDGVFWN